MLYMENREATVKNIRDTGCCMQCTKKASVQVAVVQSSEMHARLPLFPSLHKAPKPIMHGAKDDKFKSNAAPHMRESGQSRWS